MNTIVLISCMPIENDDELYIDYRLKPTRELGLPSWYATYDEKVAQRRWLKDSEIDEYEENNMKQINQENSNIPNHNNIN